MIMLEIFSWVVQFAISLYETSFITCPHFTSGESEASNVKEFGPNNPAGDRIEIQTHAVWLCSPYSHQYKMVFNSTDSSGPLG